MTAAPSHLSNATEIALRLLQASSCFRPGAACGSLPCACAQSLVDAISPQAQAGEWDKGEHEGCGVDSQRALDRFNGVAQQPMSRDQIAQIFAYIWHGDVTEWRGFLSKADAFLAYPSPPAALPAGENLPTLDEYRNNLIEECVKLIRYCGECDCPRMTADAIKGLAIPSTSRTCPDCGMREACDDECPNAPLPSTEGK